MRFLPALLVALLLTPLVRAQTAPTSRPATRVACVGDSITFGVGVRDPKTGGYPALLQQVLGDGYEVKNFGVSGATALRHSNRPYVETRPFKLVQEYKPDIVVIMLGTNDSKHPVPATMPTPAGTQPAVPDNWSRKAEFIDDYTFILRAFRDANPAMKLYVATPVPAYPPGLGGINPQTIRDEIVPMVREIAQANGATIIDLHAALSDQPEKFPDHVHPSSAGAKVIAETVAKVLTDAK